MNLDMVGRDQQSLDGVQFCRCKKYGDVKQNYLEKK